MHTFFSKAINMYWHLRSNLFNPCYPCWINASQLHAGNGRQKRQMWWVPTERPQLESSTRGWGNGVRVLPEEGEGLGGLVWVLLLERDGQV